MLWRICITRNISYSRWILLFIFIFIFFCFHLGYRELPFSFINSFLMHCLLLFAAFFSLLLLLRGFFVSFTIFHDCCLTQPMQNGKLWWMNYTSNEIIIMYICLYNCQGVKTQGKLMIITDTIRYLHTKNRNKEEKKLTRNWNERTPTSSIIAHSIGY